MIWIGINKANLKEWFEDKKQFSDVMWACEFLMASEIEGVEREATR